jgi:hypothetical protein
MVVSCNQNSRKKRETATVPEKYGSCGGVVTNEVVIFLQLSWLGDSVLFCLD